MVKKTLKKLKVPFGLAGVSIGTNLLGNALGKKLPVGMANPLTSLGTSSAMASGLSGNLAFTGMILEQTKKLNPTKKKKK